jgi:hypothetical protein
MSLHAYPSLLHALIMPQQGDMTLSLIAHAPKPRMWLKCNLELRVGVGGGGGGGDRIDKGKINKNNPKFGQKKN